MMDKKSIVLKRIEEEKDILFSKFSPLNKQDKIKTWEDIYNLAYSLDIIPDKGWKYLRDTVWSNWRRRVMAKVENARRHGTRGINFTFTEREKIILNIIGKNIPRITETDTPSSVKPKEDNMRDNDSIIDCDDVIEQDVSEDDQTIDPLDNTIGKKRSFFKISPKQKDWECTAKLKKRKLELEIKNLELSNIKLELEIHHMQSNKEQLDQLKNLLSPASQLNSLKSST